MAEKNYRAIVPPFWMGTRDNVPEVAINDAEWQDAENMEWMGTRPGPATVVVLESGTAVVGLHFFRDPKGVQHRVAVLANGHLYEDAAQKVTGLSGKPPVILSGLGSVTVLDPAGQPWWRRPIDGVWMRLPVPAAWTPKVGAYDPIGRRLFVAPTDVGPDSWAWSAVDDLTLWPSGVGGGQGPVGVDLQAIQAIGPAVGDNLAIYKDERIYLRVGEDPASWLFRDVSADTGTLSPRAVVPVGHGNHFIHKSGVYLLNALGSLVFPPLTDPITERWWSKLPTDGNLAGAHATWDPIHHLLYLWMPAPGTALVSTDPSTWGTAQPFPTCYVLSLKWGGVNRYALPAVCSAWDGSVVHIGETNGAISTLTGTNDHGVAIASTVTSKVFGDPLSTKGWGENLQMAVLLKGPAGGSVKITPRFYSASGMAAGTQQAVALTGSLVRALVPLDAQQSWGVDLKFDATAPWRLIGYVVPEEMLAAV